MNCTVFDQSRLDVREYILSPGRAKFRGEVADPILSQIITATSAAKDGHGAKYGPECYGAIRTMLSTRIGSPDALKLFDELISQPETNGKTNCPPNDCCGTVGSPKKDYKLTESGNAERFVDQHGHHARFVGKWHKWIIFDGQRWKIDDGQRVKAWMLETVRAMWVEGANLSKDERRELTRHVLASESNAKLSGALAIAQALLPLDHSGLDQHPFLLNCANGTVNLETGELQAHRAEDFLTQLCPTNYNPDAPSYHWDRFIESIFGGDQELIDFMARYLGYCTCGSVREDSMAIFYGSGSNGKSCLLNAFMRAIGSDYAMQGASDFLIAKRGERHPTELCDLYRRRLAAFTETGECARLDEAKVKFLTGKDVIRARRMREDTWEFDPTHTLIISTNHKPEIRGGDHAIWRRLALVPFNVRYWNPDKGETGPEELRQDKNLPEALEQEAEGILAWAVRGCLEWQKKGLAMPEAVKAATAEYREDEDVIERFISECCYTNTGHSVKASQIYSAYCEWCESNGEHPKKQRTFGGLLTERGFARDKSGVVSYRGIGLKATHD